MSITLNSTMNKVPPFRMSAGRPIATSYESDIQENLHYLHAKQWPNWMYQHWQSDTATPYLEPTSTSYVLHGIWRRRVYSDLNELIVGYYREELGGAQSGTIKVDLASDAGTYVQTDTIAAGSSGAWDSMFLAQDPTQTRDTLRLYTKEDATGATLRVHSVYCRPAMLTSIAAEKTGAGFIPQDSNVYAANAPLSSWYRQSQYNNLEILRKTRSDTIVNWSEDWNIRTPNAEAYHKTSASYVKVAQIRFKSGIGQDSIEWACTGYRTGTAGGVKCSTGYMEEQLGTSVEQAFSAKASSPYTANIHDPSDLVCLPNKSDYLNVYVKGDGSSRAVLMGLSAWFGDV